LGAIDEKDEKKAITRPERKKLKPKDQKRNYKRKRKNDSSV